jgi:hypothetical protein
MFKTGAMELMAEILENTGSDQWSSMGLSETTTASGLSSLQEVQDNSRALLTYWEME